ncbi:MAG: hypothetical protein ACE5JG_12790, partial [Planctomycetota bacterium]
MRTALALLALAAAAAAGKEDDRIVRAALTAFTGGSIEDLGPARDKIVAHYARAGPRYRESTRRQIAAQFGGRLKRSEDYLAICAETLARCGTSGLRKLKEVW